MGRVYVTSDWHLGHTKACEFSGTFSSQEEREGTILENYLSIVKKRDVVWFLGDIAFTEENLDIVKHLPGDKRLILGNHDTDRCGRTEKITIDRISSAFQQVHSMVNYKNAWLTHAPIHPCELRTKLNIHGHVHGNSVRFGIKGELDTRYYNACLEVNDFKPKLFQEIMNERKVHP